MSQGPLARSTDLILEELGEELLVYDTQADRGHSLSPEAARVWRRCDGATPAEGLSAQLDLDPDTVERALDELDGCELLEERPEPAGGHTRRELTVKMVTVAGAAAAAPLILSVAAPTPAMAQTVGQCGEFSANNCGTGSGCTGLPGCCCCVPPVKRDQTDPPVSGPCVGFFAANPGQQQCKTCVPTAQQFTLCPQFGHGAGTSCSATG